MKTTVLRRILCIATVLALVLATNVPAYAWWTSRTVNKTMNVSNKVFGFAAQDIISFYTYGNGKIEDINVRQKDLNLLGVATISQAGAEVFPRTNKIRTYWNYRISLPFLSVFGVNLSVSTRCIEYTLYADGTVTSTIIYTKWLK